MKAQKKAPGTAKGQVLTTINPNCKGTQSLPTLQEGSDKNSLPLGWVKIGAQFYNYNYFPVDDDNRNAELCLKPVPREDIKERAREKNILANIPAYDGFVTIPSHTDYQQVFEMMGRRFVNRYRAISYNPQEGDCSKTLDYLKHLFGKQLYLGLDWLQLLYLRPAQKLPALLFVGPSKTGKTTFIHWMNALYGKNATYNTNEEFLSQFNSDWGDKGFIGIDEVSLKTDKESERLKSLITANKIKIEAKGLDRVEVPFCGHFAMTSNNERNPVFLQTGEDRYWAIKVPVLENENTNLLAELTQELPAFLYFLTQRQLTTDDGKRSRLWFRRDEIETEALRKMEHYQTSPLIQSIDNVLEDIMDRAEVDMVQFSLEDMLRLLENDKVRTDKHKIRDVLHERGLRVGEKKSYTAYLSFDSLSGNYNTIRQQDRFYTVKREDLGKNFSR